MTLYLPKIVTLLNGLQLIAVERPYGKVFALALAIRAGSFDDPSGLPGMAHFCEHLAFRGPNRNLFETLPRLGVEINASTSYEYTLFTARGHVENIELGLTFIANVLRVVPRTAEEIAAEQQIFRHEHSDEETSSREAAFDLYRRSTLGDPQWKVTVRKLRSRIKRLTAEVVNPFIVAHYHPANARLTVVAPIEAQMLARSLEELLPPPTQRQASESAGRLENRRPPRRLTLVVDGFRYVWINFVYVVQQTDIVSRLTAMVLSDHLGQGPHSELFRRLRLEKTLAYTVHAADLLHLHCTAIYCHTCVPSRSVKEALRVLLDCENEIRTNGFSADQLELIKRRMMRGKEMHLDYPEHLAAHLAYEAFRPPAEALLVPDDHVQRICNLTLDEVNDAARAILAPANRFAFFGGRVGPLTRWHIRSKLTKSRY